MTDGSSGTETTDSEYEDIVVSDEEAVRLDVGPVTVPLSSLEIGGGILAALTFVATPLATGLPAGYCAWKIRSHKPLSATLIAAIVAFTSVMWLFLAFGNTLIDALPSPSGLPIPAFLALALLPPLVLVGAGVGAYLLLSGSDTRR